jgi:Uri superfamily endonuclease
VRNAKGIYVLAIRISEDIVMGVGALGETRFQVGTYVYVGSAQANLEQRVRRHLGTEKRLFWHIDYLLNSPSAKIEKAFWMQGEKAAECVVAQELGGRGEPVAGFGCSDCRCPSHLFRVAGAAFLEEKMKPLEFST